MRDDSFGLEDDQSIEGIQILIKFEELSVPDETVTQFVNGVAIRVRLLEKRFIERIRNLSFGNQLFGR